MGLVYPSPVAASLTIRQARLVLPERVVTGDLVVDRGVITEIGPVATRPAGESIDGRGLVVLPGVVDSEVHLDCLEDIAAMVPGLLAGGITSAVGVRNATSAAQLDAELEAAGSAGVHLGLYLRARAGGPTERGQARAVYVSGELLHSDDADAWFASGHPLVVDTVDAATFARRRAMWSDGAEPAEITKVHDVDLAVAGLRRALELQARHGARVHLLHVSTAEEVALLPPPGRITAAIRPAHLLFDADGAYPTLGHRAVTTPPVRNRRHRPALWGAVRSGAAMIASGHRPVRAANKDHPWPHPGWPVAEFLLPALLSAPEVQRTSNGAGLVELARALSDAPARMLGLGRKGRLETGYDGDLVLIDPESARAVGPPYHGSADWSPFDGQRLVGFPKIVVLRGEIAWVDGAPTGGARGRRL